MTTPNIHPQKTTVNRLLLFFLIGFTTAVPLLLFGLFFFSLVNIFLMPLVIFVVLIVIAAREKRISIVKPGWLEYFLSFLGAFYPPVLAAIVLWLVWWVVFAIGALFVDADLSGPVYDFAGVVYGVLSLGIAIFLVRLNWHHVANQLYPQMGSQTAFAQITEVGKSWLIKRGVLYTILFVVMLVIYLLVSGSLFSDGENLTVGDELLLGGFFIVIYLFILTVSTWLWLRQPMKQFDVSEMNEVLSRPLNASGFKVRTIAELKAEPQQAVEISDFMTASVDLVASKEDGSLVIDIMTLQETTKAPDWVMASEFRTATGYLQSVLQLPKPVEAIFVLVDVLPDDSMVAFTESQNINLIQLTSEEVAGWLASDGSLTTLPKEAAAIFSSLGLNNLNGVPSLEPALENGGQNG